MSNIRPIGDPAIATAMLATMQSIDAARKAPSGISEPHWRILQCIAKAAPNVPTPGELRLCSGLNKAALAEHVQALQWKGLLEMGGYRLSPSAAAMVGVEHPYPPKEAKAMVICAPAAPQEHVEKLRAAITALGVQDMSIFPAPTPPTFIGVDFGSRPDIAVEALVRVGDDGRIELVRVLSPLDPADVPACMRPDCMPPEKPIERKTREEAAATPVRSDAIARADGSRRRVSPRHGAAGADEPRAAARTADAVSAESREPAQKLTSPKAEGNKQANKHGRGGAAVARPLQGAERCDRVAPDRISGVGPDTSLVRIQPPANPIKPQVSTPPATPPKFTNWIEERAARINAAIAFLGSLGIPVSVADRSADIRTYFVSANRRSLFAEEVIEFAIEKGWVE